MKKIIIALMAGALAFSCNDHRSSERNDDYDDTETEAVEPADEGSDTTSTWDQDRDRDHNDRMDNDESGAQRDTTSTWDQDRDRVHVENDSIR